MFDAYRKRTAAVMVVGALIYVLGIDLVVVYISHSLFILINANQEMHVITTISRLQRLARHIQLLPKIRKVGQTRNLMSFFCKRHWPRLQAVSRHGRW
jgi:hypothetical protein